MAELPILPIFPPDLNSSLIQAGGQVQVGLDLVQISRIRASVEQFGARFMQRVFTAHELDYACASPILQAERLAARFAAKEATLKALAMADQGVAWRDMEVRRQPDGRCDIVLYAKAAEHARQIGVTQLALSLSHDGDYASAIVVAVTPSSNPAHFCHTT